jgi:hypothetical protein
MPGPTSLKLTKDNILYSEEQYDYAAATFYAKIRSRNLQSAGKSMGFNLKLDCYEQATIEINDWCDSQDTLFEVRPIFKDSQDLVEVATIAKEFEVALGHGLYKERQN